VVYLPKERLVCTGDLFNGYIGYMATRTSTNGPIPSTPRRARLRDRGRRHGKPFRGKEALPAVQACLRDLWRQAVSFKTSGLSAAEAATRIDLTAHRRSLPSPGEKGFEPLAVERIYAVIDERRAKAASK